MPISNGELIVKLYERYGCLVRPTPGENAYYELMSDSGTLLREQERRDALRLAESARLTDDQGMAEIALARWNALFPENTYSSIEMLLGVENEF